MPLLGSRDQIARRSAALDRFAAWEARAATDAAIDAGDAVARVGFLWSLLPEAARRDERDPQRAGVRRMHRILAQIEEHS